MAGWFLVSTGYKSAQRSIRSYRDSSSPLREATAATVVHCCALFASSLVVRLIRDSSVRVTSALATVSVVGLYDTEYKVTFARVARIMHAGFDPSAQAYSKKLRPGY